MFISFHVEIVENKWAFTPFVYDWWIIFGILFLTLVSSIISLNGVIIVSIYDVSILIFIFSDGSFLLIKLSIIGGPYKKFTLSKKLVSSL